MSKLSASGCQSIGVSASASVLQMNIQELISFRIYWFDLLAVQGTLKSLLQHHSSEASILQCSAFFWSNSHICTWLLEKPNHSLLLTSPIYAPINYLLPSSPITCHLWSIHRLLAACLSSVFNILWKQAPWSPSEGERAWFFICSWSSRVPCRTAPASGSWHTRTQLK